MSYGPLTFGSEAETERGETPEMGITKCGDTVHCETVCGMVEHGEDCPTLEQVWDACDLAGVRLSDLFSSKTCPQPA